MIKIGDRVKYIGEDTVAFEKGKIYKVVGEDKELEAFAVMSELDEDYLLSPADLEEIK